MGGRQELSLGRRRGRGAGGGVVFRAVLANDGRPIFLYFALAFAVEAIDRTLLGITSVSQESEPLIYSLRLVSYGLILIAIIDKNRKGYPR